jgi:hypothetical protein
LSSVNSLFGSKLNVLNVGLEQFYMTLQQQNVESAHVEWKPRAQGDPELVKIVDALTADLRVAEANQKAFGKLNSASPVWIDVRSAHEAIDLDRYTLLHAGPPIEFKDMCVPMQGAVVAALKYEGLAENDDQAFELAKTRIHFEPCHHYGCVGPMTGVISYSMPLLCVKNTDNGNMAYSTFNEGAGDVARFGAFGENTVRRLKWIENVLAPVMKKVVETEPINLKVLISQALNMGDELHMRNNSSTSIFLKTIMTNLTKSADMTVLPEIARFLTTNNDQFFLNFAMAAMKASADAANNIPYSTMVTAMARNGVNIGIRVSGLGDQWFIAPAAQVVGLYFPGYTEEDANPDIGDSAIMETGGVGGFAMAAAPAIVKFLGAGTVADALNYTNEMYDICLGESAMFAIPNLDFRGSPLGIDIIKVVETGCLPVINTAIASKKAGGGMVGAGVARAPMPMFKEAIKKLYKQMEE